MHHRRATTSWFLGPEFLKRYPTVALDLDTMVVVDGNLITSRNPDDLEAFGAAIVEEFAKSEDDEAVDATA